MPCGGDAATIEECGGDEVNHVYLCMERSATNHRAHAFGYFGMMGGEHGRCKVAWHDHEKLATWRSHAPP